MVMWRKSSSAITLKPMRSNRVPKISSGPMVGDVAVTKIFAKVFNCPLSFSFNGKKTKLIVISLVNYRCT